VEAKPLPGTENGHYPFFSPDGQWIGFFADGKLKKTSNRGGPAEVLCEAPQGSGGFWGPDDTILFTPTFATGLFQVSASGGDPKPITAVREGEMGHFFPHFLPGSKDVLFASVFPKQKVEVASLETGERKHLLENASMPVYSPTGHLIFVRQWTLMAVPFDLERREIVGSPAPLFEGILQSSINSSASYALADNGTLVYVTRDRTRESTLVSVDRQGTVRELITRPGLFYFPQISPDGKRLAVTMNSGTPSFSAWMYDMERGTLSLFDDEGFGAIWTPDGERITYSREGSIYLKASDGSGEPEPLLPRPLTQIPNSWSPDGNILAYAEFNSDTGLDLRIYPSDGEPVPLFDSPFDEHSGRFSRDGKYFAYASNESGRTEVYVMEFPGPGAKWQISTEGGIHPVWSWDGRRLYYRRPGTIYSVAIETDSEFSASMPEVIYSGPYLGAVNFGLPYYDVSPDGEDVFLIRAAGQEERQSTQVHVVLNWFEELKRLVPTEN
jgi:serine/threonine-protein kinase